MDLSPVTADAPALPRIRTARCEERTPRITEFAFRGSVTRVFRYEPGRAASPDGPSAGPLFIGVHGFRGDHHGFEQLVFAHGGSWMVPDFPGFGASTRMGPGQVHDAEAYGDLLVELVEAARAEQPERPIVVVGHSFGTVVVSRAARRIAEAAAGVVLVNPISVPALEGSSPLAAGAATAYYRAAQALPRPLGMALVRSRLITDAMTLMMRTSSDQSVRAYTDEQHRAYFAGFEDREVLSEAYASSLRDSVRERAADFALPVLLIAGEKDAFGSPAAQAALAAAMPQARLVMIEGVGHLIHYEAADAASAALRRFAESLAA